ncbi:hypothetical protein KUM39_06485 [Streptomyces sp. J2-1]|uniref:hypothetical protein n=1 Tax=Streptomyces corallincola TaxID=2851888 RepID=UPI001C3884C0|nr:hypothetical protein [Streptomyces corallincola]MBV2354011.1 hypothetical protein [Streptomyces corallincola]
MKSSKLTRTLAITAAALAAVTVQQSTARADVPPEHAIIVCQTASFYANYDSASGPTGLVRTLTYGKKVGHTRGAHPIYNGWAATFDFGPNDWGYVRNECIGGYDSW